MEIRKNQSDSKLFPFLMCAIASLFLLYEFVLQISPSIMTRNLMAHFQVDAFTLGIASALFYYAYTPCQLIGGFLYDRFGAKRVLTFAALACASGALCIALANDIVWVGVGRFLMGAGAAFAFVGVLFVGAMWLPAKYFASVAGFTELMGCLGAVVAETPLVLAVNQYGWNSVILWLAFLGYFLAFCYWFMIKDKAQTEKQTTYHFLSVFKNSQLWAIGLYALFIFAPISIFAGLWGIPFLQAKFHVSTFEAGKACSMIWIGMAIGSIILGLVSDFCLRRKLPLLVSSALGIIISLILLYQPISFSSIYGILFLFGAATSGQALSFAVVKDNVGSTNVGLAMGFNNMFAASGGAFFQPLVGYFLRTHWDGKMINQVPIYTLEQYKTALIVLPICYLISGFIGWYFIRETYCVRDANISFSYPNKLVDES